METITEKQSGNPFDESLISHGILNSLNRLNPVFRLFHLRDDSTENDSFSGFDDQ